MSQQEPGGNRDAVSIPVMATSWPVRHSFGLVTLGLIVLVLAVFARALHADFVNYDDPDYVFANPSVNNGLVLKNVVWAFTSIHSHNWHPVTWLSHMLDCELFGLEPSGHHAANILIHAANTAILFWLLRRLTGEFWPCAAVAALWAVHPLRVESVAWVAERKDVLSGLFFLLTIAAYTTYARSPSILRYGLVLLLFALGLMAKPMLVTTPFVLLLLDYWPLNRIGFSSPKRILRNVLLEKLPLIALSVISSVITMSAQTDAMKWGAGRLSLEYRIGNVFVSYAVYLMQLFYPFDLAVLYPHPREGNETWQVAGSCILLVAITMGSLRLIRSAPYSIVGWFWFLGMLVPVIGLIQVGLQAHADRYTYLPHIGLIWAIVWAGRLVGSSRVKVLIGLGAILAFAVISWCQVPVWNDAVRLFAHTVACTDGNHVMHNNLGDEYEKRGMTEKAIEHYRLAIKIDPAYAPAHIDLGLILAKLGQNEEAIAHFRKVFDLGFAVPQPKREYWSAVYNGQGIRMAQERRFAEAIDSFRLAASIDPVQKETRQNLAKAYFDHGFARHQLGGTEQAVVLYRLAVQVNPSMVEGHNNLGVALRELKQFAEAAACFRRALELDPGNQLARKNLEDVQQKIRP